MLFIFIMIIEPCITVFMLGVAFESGFIVFKLDDLFWWFVTLGYPVSGFVDLNWNCVINCFLFDRGFRSKLQTKLYRIFGRFPRVRNFLKILSYRSGWDFCFSNELWYRDALWILGWILRNWIPLKDMRQLPRVDL